MAFLYSEMLSVRRGRAGTQFRLLPVFLPVRLHGVPDQLVELVRLPGCPAGEEAVDGGLHDELVGVTRVHAAAVENRDVRARVAEDLQEAGFDDLVHLLRIVR